MTPLDAPSTHDDASADLPHDLPHDLHAPPLSARPWDRPLPGRPLDVMLKAFVLGSAAHLWLADAWQLDWLLWNLLYAAGLLGLLWRGSVAWAWALCALGALGPLLFARDVLTQSVLLCLMATSAAWASWRAALTRDDQPWVMATARAWRALTCIVYALAALHKLNRDFLATPISCATYGVHKVWRYWGLPSGLDDSHALLALAPWAIIGVEAALALLLALGKPRAAWPLAALFHLPLTLTMAPAFALVMLAGHVAWLDQAARQALRALWRDKRRPILGAALALTAISQGAHLARGIAPHPGGFAWTMIPKEALLWTLTIWTLMLALRSLPSRPTRASLTLTLTLKRKRKRMGRVMVALVSAVMLLNGLAPYTGLKVQHAGAMLSNLRVDEGCWNSLIFPERWRLRDDYVRVEVARIGDQGRAPKHEALLKAQLWSPPQLRQMRRRWCAPWARPLMLQGTAQGRPFTIDDLCDERAPWPFERDGVLGVELFPDALRFQKNLSRACPQACLH